MNPIPTFTTALLQSLHDGSFIKLSLGNYAGDESGLQKILARKIIVKKEEKISFTSRYKTRDVVKNYGFTDSTQQVKEYLQNGFKAATLFTTEFDLQFDSKKLKKSAPTQKAPASLDHDRSKKRPIAAGKPYLHALGITDAAGNVNPTAQDKYRQINKYIEILGSLVTPKTIHIADMGAGKGYLTFALYDYMVNTLGLAPQITGVEFRDDLVALCNRIAAESHFDGLKFVQGSIESYAAKTIDLLIALHACDTATDDAIAKGIRAGAQAIVVAPCCHKQIRKEMDAAAIPFLLKHGIFMERQAEMVTDGLRALILELHGYRTKLFEFIADAHTPKNIMITAVFDKLPASARAKALREEIAQAKAQFGIRSHCLETLLA